MDTLTHALSGALVARLAADPRARAQAPVWQCVSVGAAAGAFPDVDVLLAWVSPLAYLTGHRGLTHSLLLLPLWALLLGAAAATLCRAPGRWRIFTLITALAIAAHIVGDLITSFGTMIWSPLSDARVAWGTTFVIDLWFSAILVAGLVGSALWRRARVPAAVAGVALCAYVGMQWMLMAQARELGAAYARTAALGEVRVSALPRPLSPFNWAVVVATASDYRVAQVNLLRKVPPAPPPPDAGLLARIDAGFQPPARARWEVHPRFGTRAEDIALARDAWAQPALGFFRWFAAYPALYRIDRNGTQACVWFFDLRFLTPGRSTLPFRYGLCGAGGQWRAFELLADGATRLMQ